MYKKYYTYISFNTNPFCSLPMTLISLLQYKTMAIIITSIVILIMIISTNYIISSSL